MAPKTLREGYDKRSLYVLVFLLCGYVFVGVTWRHLLDFSKGMDWLLFGIWAFMTAVLCWGIEPRRDLIRALVGLAGGLFIEAWGTETILWEYYTDERPPVWILPAWPVAAITIDRLSKAVQLYLPQQPVKVLWWLFLPPFVVWMTVFIWPTSHLLFTQIAVVGMILVCAFGGRKHQDVALMLAGAGLGLFLEYWGTSRHCWTYYTHEIPPMQAVFAHGFAAVAFQRGADLLDWALEQSPWPALYKV